MHKDNKLLILTNIIDFEILKFAYINNNNNVSSNNKQYFQQPATSQNYHTRNKNYLRALEHKSTLYFRVFLTKQ